MRFAADLETELRHCGWSPDRRVSITPFMEEAEALGCWFSLEGLEIMENFWGLVLSRDDSTWSRFWFRFPVTPNTSTDSEMVRELSDRMNCRIGFLGHTRTTYSLFLLETGRVIFTSMELRSGDIAETFEQALRVMLLEDTWSETMTFTES